MLMPHWVPCTLVTSKQVANTHTHTLTHIHTCTHRPVLLSQGLPATSKVEVPHWLKMGRQEEGVMIQREVCVCVRVCVCVCVCVCVHVVGGGGGEGGGVCGCGCGRVSVWVWVCLWVYVCVNIVLAFCRCGVTTSECLVWPGKEGVLYHSSLPHCLHAGVGRDEAAEPGCKFTFTIFGIIVYSNVFMQVWDVMKLLNLARQRHEKNVADATTAAAALKEKRAEKGNNILTATAAAIFGPKYVPATTAAVPAVCVCIWVWV